MSHAHTCYFMRMRTILKNTTCSLLFYSIHKLQDFTAFQRLNEEWQRMSEDDRSKWAGQGMLDRIRFVAEMEMYHGSGAVAQVLGKDFSPHLTARDAKEMKEREDTARRIAACTFLEIIKQKKERKKQDAVIVSPAKKVSSVASSTAKVLSSADIATIATPTTSNTSGGPKIFGDTTAPALIELSSDSSFSDEDPDEAFI